MAELGRDLAEGWTCVVGLRGTFGGPLFHAEFTALVFVIGVFMWEEPVEMFWVVKDDEGPLRSWFSCADKPETIAVSDAI